MEPNPDHNPQDEATTDLFERLREEVLPPVERAANVDVAVTGTVAVNGNAVFVTTRPAAA